MNQRLRIAYVSDMFAADHGGGVTAGRHFVENLRKEHDVVVVATDATGPADVRMPAFQLPVRAMREMHFEMAAPDRPKLASLFARVDVAHLQFPFWLSFAALGEARRAGVPVVAGFHVQPENMLLNVGVRSPFLNDLAYRRWINRLYRDVEVVVCPTEFAKNKLLAHGLRTPTVVISNGVPRDVVPGAQRRPYSGGRFRILMVGRLATEKRQEDLIRAIARSPHREHIELVIAGGGPREAELAALTRDLPNGARVGFLSREQLLRELQTADLFVHCSEVELEGIAVLEAIASGTPALVAESPESAASELAKDDDFRFPAGDVAALQAKLDRIIDEPDLLASARVWSGARARSLSIEESTARLVQSYRDVIMAHKLPLSA
jgi:glycosyltransferase involved in cell wall biosynthesis